MAFRGVSAAVLSSAESGLTQDVAPHEPRGGGPDAEADHEHRQEPERPVGGLVLAAILIPQVLWLALLTHVVLRLLT